MSAPSPQELVERALEASRSDHCIAIARVTSSANLRWANNTLTTNGVMQGITVTVIAFVDSGEGTAAGSVTGTAATADQVLRLVEAADAAAAASRPAEDAATLVDGAAAEDWHEPPAETSIDVYADFAPALGESFRRATAADRILYGFVDHDMTTTYLGSTTGLRRRHVQPTGHWGCTGKSSDLRSSAWVGGATRDFRDVDAAAMDAELERRLGWASNTVDLPAGRYDTILPPTAVADLMIYAYWVSAARTAHEGQSVYARPGGGTRIGERISRRPVHVYSDPAYDPLQAMPFLVAPASGETASVFDNGLPLARTDWVREGKLSALVQTRETAVLTGQPVTPQVDNLVVEVEGATGGLDDLVRGIERGLLVTCLWYIREVDPQSLLLTGLTRDGVYLVEGGEITGAVNNFRFNESPIDLLDRFVGASATVPSFSREWGDYFPRTATPALRVPDFNMSTVSQAQ
ncbi:MAG: TldE/PmbA family protein, Actinobacterial subgroup [uncultured Nocardioidaceae bacterium]|uniref:TldE/PmbA family protein, Actinobacterial subgroup n=1 Tax=uncultured Nocardioidaceae bacterium TaxID=253824 RepID=A0A6J4NJA1_9ACTN|nr:MAG: TldE/PmbA family protein, Actinobacterial subgroup [uncultured Nocardioidaceae bacterium]